MQEKGVRLMGEEHDTFWQLERANRRKTVELVAILVLIYAVIGFILDFIFHALRVINHHLTVVPWTGIPWLTIAAVAIALAEALWAYYRGSSVIIGAVRGDDLTAESVKEQAVLDVVNEMALAAHIPVPRVCLMEDPAPNAFATGRDPEHSVICVTRGLVDQLDREELQGTIAHELAHIRGHDTRVTQMAAVMVGGFSLLSDFVLYETATDSGTPIPGLRLIAVPVVILGGLGWLFSKVVAIALSRQREYLADAASVEFTRNPQALIRALEHIARIESPLKRALRGVAPLFIVDPFECAGASSTEYLDEVARIEAQADKTKEQREAEVVDFVVKRMPLNPFQGRFSSHPPIRDRIARLYALLHQTVPAESPEEVRAKRKAAAKIVAETMRTNPEAMAAVMAKFVEKLQGNLNLAEIAKANPEELAMLQANPQLMRGLGAIPPASGPDPAPPPADPAPPSAENQTFDNPSDQAAYQKLYEYNMKFTGDKSESPLQSLLRGQPTTIDPAQIQAALALGMASMNRKAAAASKSDPGQQTAPKKFHYLFWLVIALSAGAIIASFAIK
jgi:heat shock protein HtpX